MPPFGVPEGAAPLSGTDPHVRPSPRASDASTTTNGLAPPRRPPPVADTRLEARPSVPSRPHARARLVATVVPRDRLTEADVGRMLGLMEVCYEGVNRARFRADLAQKQEIILLLLRERGTNSLVGFSTVRRSTEGFDGRTVEVIFSGDTVIHPAHWGSKTLQAAFSRFALGRKLRQPRRPVFWFLLSGGYKTYLMMVRNLPRAWPRPGSAPPPGWRPFVDELAARWFGAEYDAARGIVRFATSHYHVRPGISPIDADAARVPEIAFFARLNPGHVDGDELVCLGELRVRDLLGVLARVLGRRLRAALRRAARLAARSDRT